MPSVNSQQDAGLRSIYIRALLLPVVRAHCFSLQIIYIWGITFSFFFFNLSRYLEHIPGTAGGIE